MSATGRSRGSKNIIVKRRRARHGGDHLPHGSWKVAYADFVTAMMAFFLLMWLVNATNEEQRDAMAEYFSGDKQLNSAVLVPIDLGGTTSTPEITDHRPPPAETAPDTAEDDSEFSFRKMKTVEITREEYEYLVSRAATLEKLDEDRELALLDPPQTPVAIPQEAGRQEMQEIWKAVATALGSQPAHSSYLQNIRIEEVPEGLKIQVFDKDDFSMFRSGATTLTPQARELLDTILKVIKQIPHEIAILGHTDSVPFRSAAGYSNWELSADRAQSARKYLINGGLEAHRIARIEGRADADPFIVTKPDDPRNRRISLVVLRFARD